MPTVQSPVHRETSASPSGVPLRRLVSVALVLGPSLVLVSALFAHTPASDSAPDVLAVVRAHRGEQLIEVLLELLGTAITFAAVAASSLGVRERGARLATWSAAAAILGIIGFAMVNAEGLVVNALAGMPQQAAAEVALTATTESPAVFVPFPLILLGELGVVGVLAAFWRAQRLPAWPAVLALGSLVVDFSGGSKELLIASDLLVLAALGWLAVGGSAARSAPRPGH